MQITMWKFKIMKASDLRRALLVLLILCGVLMVYFFCQQTSKIDIPHFSNTLSEVGTLNTKPDLRWTWKCENDHCEKIRNDGKSPLKTLTTCNMMCGVPQLWPLPTGPIRLAGGVVSFLHQQIKFETSAKEPARSFLQQSYVNFNDSINALTHTTDYWSQKFDINRFFIKVTVSFPEQVRLYMNTEERYNVTVTSDGNDLTAKIDAKTVFGARHALETLSQLIWWDELEYGGTLRILDDISLQDAPVFPYRGLMLDTSRNYISVNGIKRVLNGMAANKLNVFHWHVSDSQSFPLEIPSVPQLHTSGAYGSNMVYTENDVKYLVNYARERGIRVVIEIDTPAHAGNGWTWGPDEGMGELAVCVNARPWSLYCGEPPCGQLNPENPNVYDVLEKIYKDILAMTGEDEIFHIGGDEVNLDCWEQFLTKNVTSGNYTDLHNLWGEFTLKVLKRLEKANGGKKPPHILVWSSNLSRRPYNVKYLDKDAVIIQSWGASDWTETRDLISDGYRILLSHVNAWYLDCGFGRWRERGEATCDPYRPWQTFYLHQPWAYDEPYKKQMVGAEACLWGEQLDEASLDTRLWPRAAAFAERVWSDPKVDIDSYSILEDVYTRLSTQRDRLVKRGFGVEAMWPQWCTQNPGMCL